MIGKRHFLAACAVAACGIQPALADTYPSRPIRLLIPAGSRLLQLPEVRRMAAEFDPSALTYRWSHPDPRVDRLQQDVERMVQESTAAGWDRAAIFHEAWRRTRQALEQDRRYASDWCRHLCRRPQLRGIGDGLRRDVHPRRGRP